MTVTLTSRHRLPRHAFGPSDLVASRVAGRVTVCHVTAVERLRRATSCNGCVTVAQGDFVGTPKITEMIAIGAAGGCIPVIVLPARSASSILLTLPYVRWLDYCGMLYFASNRIVRDARALAATLDFLEGVTAEEAERRRAALRAVRDAFVVRPN